MSKTMQLRVTTIAWKAQGIRSIEFSALDGAPLPPFTAGSHIDLHLPTGLVRSYSLTNGPGAPNRYVIGVARDRASRGGSSYLHDNLRVGDILRVGAPRNLFQLDEQAPSFVLIAGGIGVTPMVCMAGRLAELGRDWTLYYAVRERGEAGFMPDLERFGGHIRLHCDDEAGGVINLRPILAAAPPQAHVYCCGPAPMMRAFGHLTGEVAPHRIHVEHFSPLESAAVEGGFLVELARSGRTVAVPQGSTILEALANAGVAAPNSCQQGVCGTCETKVLSGIPDHRDSVLTSVERAENRTMMICCSGSLSERLVLDL
jgi:vanillate O-demethylase ferredoxin subunit